MIETYQLLLHVHGRELPDGNIRAGGKGNGKVIQGIHKRMLRFQKFTKNLFLNLQGHNVHRQQQQLSKFLMRYKQFASRAYCGASGPSSKMASEQGKVFCVLRFEVSEICDYNAA